jgi:PKHD-type hydroxylase
MILCIGDVLGSEDLAEARGLLSTAAFHDGRNTAGWAARLVKNNEQVIRGSNEHSRLVEIVIKAIAANTVFQAAALPKVLRPPLFSRATVGMAYGTHVDDAMMGEPPARSDISYTLFLSDPDAYSGGELVIESSEGEQAFKLAAGGLVLYPSTFLHRVETVTAGERLVAVGWVQSLCRDPRQREILFDLAFLRRSVFEREGKSKIFDLIAKTYSNVLRLLADV